MIKYMLALVVARSGAVRDGLLALLEASPDINKIVQVGEAQPACEFARTICPDITLIYDTSAAQELSRSIAKLKGACHSPILAIVASDENRQTAVSSGADITVLEGLPSSKLASHIAQLIQKPSVVYADSPSQRG